MKGSARVLIALLLCTGLLLAGGCESYKRQVQPLKMPSAYPNAMEVAGVTIAAKSYHDRQEAKEAFGFDIVGAGLIPVQVIFDNKGKGAVEIVTAQTFLVDRENNLWPILESSMAYERIDKKTELGKVVPEGAKYGALAGIAGGIVGAAVGIVAGRNVGQAALQGAAVGAAAGAVLGGSRGLMDKDTQARIREDLQKRGLENKPIAPGDISYGFLFFPGESSKPDELRLRVREKANGGTHALIFKLSE